MAADILVVVVTGVRRTMVRPRGPHFLVPKGVRFL